MAGADDLTPFLLPPPDGDGLNFGQGVILEYNQLTASNKVQYRGSLLVDLPLLNSSEAVLLKPGAVVSILSWRRSYFILGRVTQPNSPDAASALDMIRVESAEISGDDSTADTGGQWVDLDFGPPGPLVEEVLISRSGRALVTVGADVLVAPADPDGFIDALMAFEISGASTRSPQLDEAFKASYQRPSGTGLPAIEVGASRTSIVEGLNSGLHTITAKYQVFAPTAGDAAHWQGRNITVIPF